MFDLYSPSMVFTIESMLILSLNYFSLMINQQTEATKSAWNTEKGWQKCAIKKFWAGVNREESFDDLHGYVRKSFLQKVAGLIHRVLIR